MGTLYLMVPKLRSRGYILFFVTERKRSEDSYLRLVTTYLIEYAEDWAVSRAYLNPKSIQALL